MRSKMSQGETATDMATGTVTDRTDKAPGPEDHVTGEARDLARLVELGIALSAERSRDKLNHLILTAARDFTHADGGSLYLINKDETELHFRILVNETLGMYVSDGDQQQYPFPPLQLYLPETGAPNHNNIATYVALSGEAINIADAYDAKGFDFSGTRRFDAATGYRSKSFLTVPLKNTRGQCFGVLQLINARDAAGNVIAFEPSVEPLIGALASQAAVATENRRLLRSQRDLMDSFVRVLAHAIDAKSAHTAKHCSRVPVIARMIAQAAVEQTDGSFADFTLSQDEWRELDLAAWLHDCGKISTPGHVIEKATKLETIHNRIHEIRTRFEVLRRDAEIEMLKRQLAGEDKAVCEADFKARVEQLEAQFAIVAQANEGGEQLLPETGVLLESIGAQEWQRHFDKTLGLSWAESQAIDKDAAKRLREPGTEKLLGDQPDYSPDGLNRAEIYNLLVSRGTLTADEHRVVRDHIVLTQEMLAQLPFPRELRRIPAIAGNHHEKLDGSGYPKGLKGEEMGVLEKVMVIADIFEALTAVDRPYKKPKMLSECIAILGKMRDDGLIDSDVFEVFLASGVHEQYAQEYLQPDQRDHVDTAQYLRV
jgi:HD-GYP domain-containing protein (c-di-GMP phosphodiesterase class II)